MKDAFMKLLFSKNSDRGHCYFLKSTWDIGLFQNRLENSEMVTGDIAFS